MISIKEAWQTYKYSFNECGDDPIALWGLGVYTVVMIIPAIIFILYSLITYVWKMIGNFIYG